MVQRSFASVLKKIEADLDLVRTEFLRNIAEDLVASSPVDTGNYVSNHSITTSTGSGGRTNSHGLPKDNGTAKQKALTKLYGQVAAIPPKTTTVYIANRSPYANKVEYSGWRGKDKSTAPYRVFTTVKNRANIHLQNAVNKVRGSK
jgi:hypothetical protein